MRLPCILASTEELLSTPSCIQKVQTRYGEVAEITVVLDDYLGSRGQTKIPAQAGLTVTQIN